MNAGRGGDWLRREFEQHLLECLRRIGNADVRGIDRLRKIRRNKNCRCTGFAQQADVFSVSKKADFSGSGFHQRRGACDLQRWITDQLAARCPRQFLKSESHGSVKALGFWERTRLACWFRRRAETIFSFKPRPQRRSSGEGKVRD